MNLCTIDQGNSSHSIYQWSDSGESEKISYSINKSTPGKFIVSNVSDDSLELPKNTIYASFNGEDHFCEMPINYEHKPGIDRLLFALSIYSQINKKNNAKYLLIDAGTFLTVDLVDHTGFNGGLILPGRKLIQETYSSGHQLKTYPSNQKYQKKQFPLKNTSDSINFSWDICLTGLYKQILELNKIEHVYLTGGGHKHQQELLLSAQVSSSQITTQESAVHHGLYLYHKYTSNLSTT